MALLNSKKQAKQKLTSQDINIKNDLSIDIGEKTYSSKDRKPVQVDPPVLTMIRNLAYAKDKPMYEIVKLAMQAYLTTLSDEERTLYDKRPNKF